MNISNNLVGNNPYQSRTEAPQEASATFTEEVSSTKPSPYHQDTIFTTQNSASTDYTVHQTGKFPDTSFFEETFQTFQGNFDGQVEGIITPEGKIIGYGTSDYTVYYEYAQDSTPENPIMNVRLEFPDQQQAWEGTVNLHEIDPKDASHMEMSLLSAHLTGEPFPVPALNLGADDPFSKVNFLEIFQEALEYAKNQGDIYRNFDMLELLEKHFQHFEDYMAERLEEEEKTEETEKIHLENQLEQEQMARQLMASIN